MGFTGSSDTVLRSMCKIYDLSAGLHALGVFRAFSRHAVDAGKDTRERAHGVERANRFHAAMG